MTDTRTGSPVGMGGGGFRTLAGGTVRPADAGAGASAAEEGERS